MPSRRATSSVCCPSPWSATSATWCSAWRCPRWRGWARPSSTWRTTSPSRPACSWSPGLIERRGGSSSVDRLAGLAKLSPVLAVLFFVPAMNLAGIPPFSGFLGKLGLMQAGIAARHPAGLRPGHRRRGDQPADPAGGGPGLEPRVLAQGRGRRAPRPCAAGGIPRTRPRATGRASATSPCCRGPWSGSTLGLVVLGVALTVFAGPLFQVADQSAARCWTGPPTSRRCSVTARPVPGLAGPDGAAGAGGAK